MTTARYAALVSEFGLKLHEVMELSPRQINDFYFHKRKEDGTLDVPRAPEVGDRRARLHMLLALIEGGFVKASPEDLAKLKGMQDGLGRGPDKAGE